MDANDRPRPTVDVAPRQDAPANPAAGPYARRRGQLLDVMDGVAILPAAPVTIRNNDVEHDYRQDSDLFYFTGFDEPESLLVLSTCHPEHRSVLFVRPRDREREVWDGARAGVDGARERCGVDATFPIAELPTRLKDYVSGAHNLYYEVGRSEQLDAQILAAITQARGRGRNPKPWPTKILHPEPLWHEMRLRKDDGEIDAMREAARITAEAHIGAMRLAAPGRHEYEVEALFREVFRRNGAERDAYGPIIGSGPNATVLHYRANNRRMEDGELLLIDAGCEYGYYASDVTRTFPVNGTFSEPQRRLYEVVLAAQLAAIEATKPGADIEALHRITIRALSEGMVAAGLLEGDVDEIVEKETYRRYYMHRTSHWLGMDVHDVGAYFLDGKPRPLEPGMVFTIEPGIYVAADDDRAPEELRGIGIRIEDDVLVTGAGHEVLTRAIPKTIEDVERACRA
ncbi:MAG: aminopeptidase P N-terminal domain-containing protein [Polyangiaceae bacterium]